MHKSRLIRILCLISGFIALFLGVVGLLVPVLPTTPFILLAAAFFARGSQRFHDRLLANRYAGPIIRDWREHRSIPRPVKRWVYVLILFSLGMSTLLLPRLGQRALMIALAAVLLAFIWRIPARDVE